MICKCHFNHKNIYCFCKLSASYVIDVREYKILLLLFYKEKKLIDLVWLLEWNIYQIVTFLCYSDSWKKNIKELKKM